RRLAGAPRPPDPGARRLPGRLPGLRRARQRQREGPSPVVPQVERRRMLLDPRPAVPPRARRGCAYIQATDRGLRGHGPRWGVPGRREPRRWPGSRAGDGRHRALGGVGRPRPAGGCQWRDLMHLGIFAKTFPRPTIEETLDAIADRGLTHVQFNMSCVGLPTLPERIEEEYCRSI